MVRYSLTKELELVEYKHLVHSYTADSMCQSPATSYGFWHPGFTYDFLLKDSKANTRYYYRYGTEDVSCD